MRDLSTVQDGWEEIEAEETRLLRQLTLQESIRQLVALHEEFEPLLQETEELFRADRTAYLAELQERLQRLERWRGVNVENVVESAAALQERLEQAGIPSVVVGALAVGVWGEPRLTRDADMKVLLEREEAQRLLDVLSPDYTSLHRDPIQTLKRNGFLFVQDAAGTRLDLMLADTSFDVAVIRRAQAIELQPGVTVRVCTAEDLVIYKLISTRPRDYADAESVVKRQGDKLDDAYVLDWLRQFEQALADSTLVAEYQRMRAKST